MLPNNNYEALVKLGEAKRQQYLRDAAQHRLVRLAQAGQTGIWRRAAWAVGPLVVSLGGWLMKGKDICEEMRERRSSYEGNFSQR